MHAKHRRKAKISKNNESKKVHYRQKRVFKRACSNYWADDQFQRLIRVLDQLESNVCKDNNGVKQNKPGSRKELPSDNKTDYVIEREKPKRYSLSMV